MEVVAIGLPEASKAKMDEAAPLSTFQPTVEEEVTFPLLSMERSEALVSPVSQVAPRVVRVEEALAKELRPVQVLELASKVVEAEPIVALPPRPTVVPLMVKVEEVATILPEASVERTVP
jgi:hypothetical protein